LLVHDFYLVTYDWETKGRKRGRKQKELAAKKERGSGRRKKQKMAKKHILPDT
jgi:hypothetical protein